MILKRIANSAAIVVTLASVPVFAKAPAPTKATCTYTAASGALVLETEYTVENEGPRKYELKQQVEAEKVIGRHQLPIQVTGVQGLTSTCQVDIKFLSITATGRQFEVTYSKCDLEKFLLEDPQKFTCELAN